ncbi:MAG: hypothetical protein F2534_20420 [Actinobacteria bacterium]|uniref:Unannotated protein n=1 Tax=freshwater metagenome TaxID=449393 RepID=A0A6J6G2X3_9ZZZZ|nr:hypothetical protein [Actinomycetota bacterium]
MNPTRGSLRRTAGYATEVATLLDDTSTEFPNHTVEVWRRDGWSMPIRREPVDPHDIRPVRSSGSRRIPLG